MKLKTNEKAIAVQDVTNFVKKLGRKALLNEFKRVYSALPERGFLVVGDCEKRTDYLKKLLEEAKFTTANAPDSCIILASKFKKKK